MSVTVLNDNMQVNAPKHIDVRQGPWASVAAANAAINPAYRVKGLSLYVTVAGNIVEYWYKDGITDGDLIAKASSGSDPLKADLVGGKVPAAQLPAYVDDVLEFNTVADFPGVGEVGKIYVVTTGPDINKSYRWTGSIYVNISNMGSSVWGTFTGDITNQEDLMDLLAGISGGSEWFGKRNVKTDFGAIGDGVADDWAALQAASDYCIANGIRTLVMPKGTYKISKPWTFYKWNAGTELYEFFSLNVIGESTFWDIGNGTQIVTTFRNGYALGQQLGKGCSYRGLTINGEFVAPNPTYGIGQFDSPTYFNSVRADWTDGVAVDTTHAPFSGICIDPYTGVKPGDFYPNINGVDFYRGQSNQTGSTGTVIENCMIGGFICGIVSSPNGVTRNAEITLIDKVQFGHSGRGLKYGISGGQDQEKCNIARNIFCWEKCHTLFVTGVHGAQTPGNWYIENVNTAGSCIQLFDFSQAGYFPTFVRNVYAESCARFGRLYSGAGGSVKDCMVDFSEPQYVGYQAAYIDSNLNFENCTFRIYGTVLPLPLTGPATYSKVTFSGMPFSVSDNDADLPIFENSGAGIPGYSDDQTLDGATWTYSLGAKYNNLNTFGFLYNGKKWKSPAIYINAAGGGLAHVTKPAGTVASVTVTGIDVAATNYQIGRFIRFNDSLANPCSGIISARNEGAGTMTISQVSNNIVIGDFAFAGAVYYPFVDSGRFIGDFAENSTTVTNFKRYSGLNNNRIVGNVFSVPVFDNGNSFFNFTKHFARVKSIVGTTLTWGNGVIPYGYAEVQFTFNNGMCNRYYILNFNGGTQATINGWLDSNKIFGRGDEIVIAENSEREVIQRTTRGGYYPNGDGFVPVGTFITPQNYNAATLLERGVVFMAAQQDDSAAADVATLVGEFNSLLGKLRDAGILEPSALP